MYHPMDICEDLANKLKDPATSLNWYVTQNGLGERLFSSLSLGLSGIAPFFAGMHQSFPGKGWDRVAHDYLKLAAESFESSHLNDLSLFNGMVGLSFSAHLCYQNGNLYKNFLSKLDDVIAKNIDETFIKTMKKITEREESPSPFFYSLATGISGFIIYLLHRRDNMNLVTLTYECLECLVNIFSISASSHRLKLPPWYIVAGSQYLNDECNEGGYRLCLGNGVAGVLAALSMTAKEGLTVPRQKELIRSLSLWIKEAHFVANDCVFWNEVVSLKCVGDPPDKSKKNSWLNETCGIARSLVLAAQALSDKGLAEFAENAILRSLQRCCEQGPSTNVCFYYGRAGLLMLAHQLALETRRYEFSQLARKLEENIAKVYHPALMDSPSLFSGMSGLGLALLSAQDRGLVSWSKIFAV